LLTRWEEARVERECKQQEQNSGSIVAPQEHEEKEKEKGRRGGACGERERERESNMYIGEGGG
jgi:hypothetical protein